VTADVASYTRDASGNIVGLAGSSPNPLEWSTLLKDLEFPDNPSRKNVALSPTLGWEGTALQEPNVWYYNGAYHMYYTGGTSSPRIGYATATTLNGPWTKNANPVLGGTYGGYTNGAYHSSIYIEGTTINIYFVDSSDNSLLHHATSTLAAPGTVTVSGTTWALPSGGTLWGNTSILKDGSSYIIAFECSTAANSWQTGLGTMTSPTSAISVSQFPCTSLRPNAGNTTATPGGPALFKEGTKYVMYYHAGTSGSLPTYGYRATCSTSDITTWTIDNNSYPIIDRSHPYEVDQVADLFPIQDAVTGRWCCFWTAFDNAGTYAGYIMWAPGIARNMALVGTTLVPAGNNGNSMAQSNRIPQPKAYGTTALDVSTTSASYVNFGVTNVRFIPRSNKVMLTLTGAFSNTNAAAVSFFRALNGSIIGYLGAFTQISTGSGQISFCGRAVVSVNPGQRYAFDVQAKTTGGTLQCRNASFPEYETMMLTVEDVLVPAINA
jgi:hypothetical protein